MVNDNAWESADIDFPEMNKGPKIKSDKKMENEKKKEYLKSYQAIKRRVKYIEDEIQRLRADNRFNYLEDLDKSGGLKKYRIALEEQIETLVEELLFQKKRCEEIERCINELKKDKEKEIMKLKYVQGLSWKDAMYITGWSWTHIHRLHSKALDNVIIPKKNKKILKKE